MDVHPPHHRIDTWRDVLVHLGTITLGLLIALSLESMVTWMHHRHLVHEARDTIVEEIASNRRLIGIDLRSIQDDESRIKSDLSVLLSLRGGAHLAHGSLEYRVTWSSFSDSAWRTAQSSGALGYMAYQQAQVLSDVYTQQLYVSDFAKQLYASQTQAIAPLFITGDTSTMSQEEIQLSLQRSADLLVNLRGLEQLLTQLAAQYDEVSHSTSH